MKDKKKNSKKEDLIKSEIEKFKNKSYLKLSHLQSSLLEPLIRNYTHLHPRQILYHLEINDFTLPKCQCGNELSWKDNKTGYRQYCSKQCTAKYTTIKKKQQNLKTIGVEWHSQLPAWNEKVQKTSLEKFGVDHASKTPEFLEKIKKTNLEKFGVEHPAQSEKIQEKAKQTNLKRHGVEYPSQSKEIKEKQKQTNLERHGVENPLQSKKIREKMKQTNLERYGVEYVTQTKKVQNKIRKTNMEKYGVEYFSQKHISKESRLILDNEKTFKEFIDTKTTKQILNELNISPSTFQITCRKYNIEKKEQSRIEHELAILLERLNINNVIRHDRNQIHPLELDFYFPDHQFAIEINGVYWHSDYFKDRYYHQMKWKLCKEKNINLIQIPESLWFSKFDIILSMIKHKIKITV